MKKDRRYDISGLPEAQFEPGSNEQALKNRFGIKSTKVMDDAEARALEWAVVGPDGAGAFNPDGAASWTAATGFRPDGRGKEGNVFYRCTSGLGQELQADGTVIRWDYRAELGGFLSGMDFSPSTRARAMDSTEAPVSTAVELETLVINASRNFTGSRRYGFVSMSGFCAMYEL